MQDLALHSQRPDLTSGLSILQLVPSLGGSAQLPDTGTQSPPAAQLLDLKGLVHNLTGFENCYRACITLVKQPPWPLTAPANSARVPEKPSARQSLFLAHLSYFHKIATCDCFSDAVIPLADSE
jgi:hypothetical protein